MKNPREPTDDDIGFPSKVVRPYSPRSVPWATNYLLLSSLLVAGMAVAFSGVIWVSNKRSPAGSDDLKSVESRLVTLEKQSVNTRDLQKLRDDVHKIEIRLLELEKRAKAGKPNESAMNPERQEPEKNAQPSPE